MELNHLIALHELQDALGTTGGTPGSIKPARMAAFWSISAAIAICQGRDPAGCIDHIKKALADEDAALRNTVDEAEGNYLCD